MIHMIHDFLSTWDLFAITYIVAWLIALLLSLIGVIVVARDQVFLGAALSQVSTLGVAGAMWAGSMLGARAPEWMEGNRFLTCTAIGVSVVASLLTTRPTGAGKESREAVTGWLFLLGAAGSIVIAARSPHGLEEIQRLFSSSSPLTAVWADLLTFAALTALAIVVVAVWWRPILLWIMDPATAEAAGVRTGALRMGLAAGLGVTIGLSIRCSGLIYTFGCLVLPALVAKSLCREVRAMFVVAPLVAVAAAVAGFVVANEYDYPSGQMTVSLMALLVPLAWGVRRLRPR